jgi:hypothetical protein
MLQYSKQQIDQMNVFQKFFYCLQTGGHLIRLMECIYEICNSGRQFTE